MHPVPVLSGQVEATAGSIPLGGAALLGSRTIDLREALMSHGIEQSKTNDGEWHVYAPRYVGSVLLVGSLYRALPHNRRCPVSHFSEVGLAADYLASASEDRIFIKDDERIEDEIYCGFLCAKERREGEDCALVGGCCLAKP